METNYFTILWCFLLYIDMNQPRVYLCPEPSSHLPPHPIPLGCPSAPALRALSHTSNLDWLSVSHMVIYMFQAILSNHSILAFSHRVQKTDLYIMSLLLSRIQGYCYHLSKFHICMFIYCIGVFLFDLPHCV